MHTFKKTILLSIIFFPSFFAYAQYESNTVILNPYGPDYREPKIYGAGEITPSSPVSGAQAPTEVKNSIVTKPTDLFETQKQDTSVLSNLFSQKLKLDVKAQDDACKAGGEKSIPWTLIDGGVSIDTVDELKSVADQAVHADPRLRRVVVKENMLEMDYLQPARLFGLIPVNYLYKVSIDVNTLKTDIQNPSWLSFAKTFHTDVTEILSNNMASIFTTDAIIYVSKQNLFYKHAITINALSQSMNPVTIYPFANTFWICFIVPYFVVFLLLLGVLIGFLFYFWTKKRTERYVSRIKGTEFKRGIFPTMTGAHSKKPLEIDDDTDVSLEDYVQSKRFK